MADRKYNEKTGKLNLSISMLKLVLSIGTGKIFLRNGIGNKLNISVYVIYSL